MNWFKRKISIVVVMLMLCTSIFMCSGTLVKAEDIVPAHINFPAFDNQSNFINFEYISGFENNNINSPIWSQINPGSGISTETDVYGLRWTNTHPEDKTINLTTFTISPAVSEGTKDIASTLKSGSEIRLDALENDAVYTVSEVIFTVEATETSGGDNQGSNDNPPASNVNPGHIRIHIERDSSYTGNDPYIVWSGTSTQVSTDQDVEIPNDATELSVSMGKNEVAFLKRFQFGWRDSEGGFGEDNTYEETMWNSYGVSIPLSLDKEYALNITLNNKKNVGWAYRDNPGHASEDQIIDNAKLYLLSSHGTDANIDPNSIQEGNYGNYSEHDLIVGETYYFKLVPDYGYQVSSLQINNGPHLYPIDGNANMGIFQFQMTNTNFHFKGLVTPTSDVIENTSTKVSSPTISNGQNATDSGNLKLSISDTTTDKAAANAVEGSMAVETLNLGLEQIVSKGENNGYWSKDITTFANPVSISLNVPSSALGSNETYSIVRKHDDSYDDLDAKYDKETGTLTFDTNQFSEYTIIKKVAEAEASKSSSQTEETNNTPSTETLALIASQAAASTATLLPTVPQDEIAVAVDGTVIDTWEDLNTLITINTAVEKLTQIVVGNKNTTLPTNTLTALSSSNSKGLHLFLGESTALTFLNDGKLKKQSDVDLACTTTKSDSAVEITFAKNAKLQATVVLHSVVPTTAKEVVLYKINKNGKKIKVATLKPNANGNVCYPIKELATYRIEYK